MKAVFVYGTLMSGERLHRLIEAANPVAILPARTQGRLLSLGAYPGMIPSRGSAKWVHGEFVEFQSLEALLPAFAGYAGYGGQAGGRDEG